MMVESATPHIKGRDEYILVIMTSAEVLTERAHLGCFIRGWSSLGFYLSP